jgi:hypothetical protein
LAEIVAGFDAEVEDAEPVPDDDPVSSVCADDDVGFGVGFENICITLLSTACMHQTRTLM